jgi:hypothetical protein
MLTIAWRLRWLAARTPADMSLSATPAQHGAPINCSGKKPAMSHNAVTWFEIPTADLEREQMGDERLAVFAYEQPGAGGCLQRSAHLVAPSREGNVVGLHALN